MIGIMRFPKWLPLPFLATVFTRDQSHWQKGDPPIRVTRSSALGPGITLALVRLVRPYSITYSEQVTLQWLL